MSAPWLRRENSGAIVLTLHIQPGAKNTTVAGVHGEALKIRLAAPPVDGKANACLVEFVAQTLGVSRVQVALIAGSASRQKRVRVIGADAADIERLLRLANPRPLPGA